jgi:predicted amidophosphoribosyltransferase
MLGRGGDVSDFAGNAVKTTVVDLCPGCGSPMGETVGVNVYCDEKGHPVHLLRVCSHCADLFESGNFEARMRLFDRIGEVESALLLCQVLEKKMAVH